MIDGLDKPFLILLINARINNALNNKKMQIKSPKLLILRLNGIIRKNYFNTRKYMLLIIVDLCYKFFSKIRIL